MIRLGGVLMVMACLFARPVAMAAEHDDLVSASSAVAELYATGFEYASGLALDNEGNLFVSNYRVRSTVGRIAPDGTSAVYCDLLDESQPEDEASAEPAEIKIDRERRLIVADRGVGRLLRVSADGKKFDVLADRFSGERFDILRGVALSLNGDIYFTDEGSNADDGAVYHYSVRNGKVTQLAKGLAAPRGLAVTPDQDGLCVAESGKYRILLYEIKGQMLAEPKVLHQFAEPAPIEGEALPVVEGLTFDASGRLFVARGINGTIDVLDLPTGRLLRSYSAGGARATALHFHDEYLYVTLPTKEAVFRIKTGAKGFVYNSSE